MYNNLIDRSIIASVQSCVHKLSSNYFAHTHQYHTQLQKTSSSCLASCRGEIVQFFLLCLISSIENSWSREKMTVERSHALMASACNLSCSTTCGSMAIVRIRRQDLLELFIEWTKKKPWDKNQRPKSERHNVPTRVVTWEFYSGAKSQSHMNGLRFSCFQGLLHLFFFNLLQGFSNPDLETTSMDFYMSFWVVCFSCGFEKCVIDTTTTRTTTKKRNSLRHSINTPHGKD